MNSFINKLGKWVKTSSFGIICTSIALVIVICVGIIVNQSRQQPVSRPTESVQIEKPSTPSTNPSESVIPEPTIEKVKMPFTVNATIARYFFDSSDSIEIKSQALVNYDNKFVPSLGVVYTYDNATFDVVSSFSGTVVEKVNDSLYGLTIVVESEDGLRAHYCGLSDVEVYLQQEVSQGQTLGKSGESIINATLGNHLQFSLEVEGQYLNPLKTYDKSLNDITK